MIRAESTIVGASIFDRSVPMQWHLRWLDEDLAAATIVVHVVRDQHTLKSVLRTPFQHEHAIILENNLGVDAAEARSTEGNSFVLEEIRPRGGTQCLNLSEIARASMNNPVTMHTAREAKNRTDPVATM